MYLSKSFNRFKCNSRTDNADVNKSISPPFQNGIYFMVDTVLFRQYVIQLFRGPAYDNIIDTIYLSKIADLSIFYEFYFTNR